MTTLPEIARETIEHNSLLAHGCPVLAMVSGGADSVALLHLLAANELGERPVRVLHVNHLLRDEASADEAFVRDLAERLGVPVRIARFDVAAYAESERLNVEDAGRRIRYRFAEEELDAWAAETGFTPGFGRIATAHTLDDRIETFFARSIFGGGAGALGSIAASRGRVVRPLIRCGREDVRAWLAERDECWREDESNTDTSRTRAYIRHELVPVAARLNPGFRANLERTMDLLSDDDALLGSMADAFARDFAQIEPGVEIAFSREWMASLERTMARRTVRASLARAFPDASRLDAEHIERLVDGLAPGEFAHDLPFGLKAFGEYDKMIISRSDARGTVVALTLLPLPGTADIGDAGSVHAALAGAGDVAGSPHSVVIDADALSGELVVDAVRAGDRMRPLGMEGTRKLSDLLVDAKVPKRERSSIPVVRDGSSIVWLAGVRMSDDYRVRPETKRPVRLTWERD
ncbi:MAG TPA: tRNA lysidine(34) synthetase TilS [Coriobacteriia bacterium]|nr:tRNA lysidine(34) synthetase TilS [Coriobacteriia bacterium]